MTTPMQERFPDQMNEFHEQSKLMWLISGFKQNLQEEMKAHFANIENQAPGTISKSLEAGLFHKAKT